MNTKANSEANQRGAPDHRVERLEGLLSAVPLASLYKEIEIGLDRTEIDVLGVMSWYQGVVIVWHVGSRRSHGNGVSVKLRWSFTASPRSMAIVMPDDG
jgi:hypothetical protein